MLFRSRTLVTRRGAGALEGLMVSGNFFRGCGARAFLGRTIFPEDDRPEAPPVAVITYRLWDRHFGLDPHVIGQSITLNQSAFTVVGVLPRRYVGPLIGDLAGFYVPMSAQPQLSPNYPLGSPEHWWVQIMGRLAPDGKEAQAQARLEVLFRQALGAAPQRISLSVLGESLRTAGWGVALGLPAALALSAVMRSVLYGVRPFDPVTMVAAVGVLLVVAATAAARTV